jgi:membrane-bound lytic murein transglycosylase D
LAGRYNVTVEAIRSSNNMANNHLSVGQNLLIPVSANKVALAAVQPPTYVRSSTTRSSNANGKSVKIVHRVRAGESLWSIARKYRVYVHQLREWNLLDDGESALKLGQRLLIWTNRGSGVSAGRALSPG